VEVADKTDGLAAVCVSPLVTGGGEERGGGGGGGGGLKWYKTSFSLVENSKDCSTHCLV
jgi:hypothetical protein